MDLVKVFTSAEDILAAKARAFLPALFRPAWVGRNNLFAARSRGCGPRACVSRVKQQKPWKARHQQAQTFSASLTSSAALFAVLGRFALGVRGYRPAVLFRLRHVPLLGVLDGPVAGGLPQVPQFLPLVGSRDRARDAQLLAGRAPGGRDRELRQRLILGAAMGSQRADVTTGVTRRHGTTGSMELHAGNQEACTGTGHTCALRDRVGQSGTES